MGRRFKRKTKTGFPNLPRDRPDSTLPFKGTLPAIQGLETTGPPADGYNDANDDDDDDGTVVNGSIGLFFF